jgi:tRNA A-37 threonylcarbamoyl transferase component Bud32
MLRTGVASAKPENLGSALTLTAASGLDELQLPAPLLHVGRYEIQDVIGAGAMGVVYRARDPKLGRAVAIKVVRASSASSAASNRLLREAQAMALVRHPNVVPIFDVGPTDSAVFVAMPLIDGGTLKQWLRDRERSCDEILDRFLAAGRGLAAAHAAGLVHRDFKPDNVLLGAAGEVQVADFGLACLAGEETTLDPSPRPMVSGALTQTGDVLGTPAYMAPEQLRGRTSDARADQFSFCVALWEGLYGDRPFPSLDHGVADSIRARIEAIHQTPAPPRRGDRPRWIGPMIVRGLHPDPDRRWPSLQVLLDAIAARRLRRPPRRRLGLGLAAMIAILGVTAAIVVAAQPPPRPPIVAPRYYHEPLALRGDLKDPAISLDGKLIAMVVGDALLVRPIDRDENRVVVPHGIADLTIAWSPDARHVLVGTTPGIPGLSETAIVDIATGVVVPIPIPGFAVFLSSTEVAVAAPRGRTIAVFAIGPVGPAPRPADRARSTPWIETPRRVTTCEVPGDYAFMTLSVGMPDGTMVADLRDGEAHRLVIVGRDCRVRGWFDSEPVASVAATDTGTLVAGVARDGATEVVELSLDGAVLSRRRLAADAGAVIRRVQGVDYLVNRTWRTRLIRIHDGALVPEAEVNGRVTFSLASDGTLAWIELGDQAETAGTLRLTTVADVAVRTTRGLIYSAWMVAWSPTGDRLAVLTDASADPEPGDDGSAPAPPCASPRIVVIDRSGAVLERLPLDHLSRTGAPVWLTDHRIAAQSDDLKTYRWYDVETGERGDVVDSLRGSTYWLNRSPVDGALAMWRMGTPGEVDERTDHLYIQPAGQPVQPIHVGTALRHILAPSWSATGELLVRELDRSVVSRVDLTTGAFTPIAQLPVSAEEILFDYHLDALPDGDLLGVATDASYHVAAIRPSNDTGPRSRPPQGGRP